MGRPRLLPILLGALLAAPLPAGADAAAPRTFDGRGVVRGDLGPARGAPLEAARDALERSADSLEIDAGNYTFSSVRTSIVGVHVRGTQVRDGIAVEGTTVAVDIVGGRIWRVEAHGTTLPGGASSSPVPRAGAVSAALAATGVASPHGAPAVERLLARRNGRLVDTWRVSVFSLRPAVAATVDVEAASGLVAAVRDDRVMADGTATVFDPNAVVAARDNTLREPIEAGGVDPDLDSAPLTAALTTLPLREFDATFFPTGRIVGPWVDVRGHGPHVGTALTYTRGDKRFEGPMAYAHLDRMQRYFQALGFTGAAGVNAEPQDTYTIRVEGFDNSFYMPAQDLMLFGAGGVDDAEDGEVVLHEYGHAVQDAQVPGWGNTHEGGSMGEGFGDWLAGNYYAGSISRGFQDECIADWDATSYSDENPPCLRRLDRDKHYPEDMTNTSVHADGEIWSAFLWTIRNTLPRKSLDRVPRTTLTGGPRQQLPESELRTGNSMRLVLTSHEFLTPNADFGDGVAALLMAADALRHPEWTPYVVRAAKRYGLPLS
jgi:hypothetical protein